MNASVEALPVAHRAHLVPVPAPEMVVREGVLDVPGEVSLYHGGRLSGIRIAWRLAGPANAPVVCALGGISANRRVFDEENPKQGWWSEVVGPGRALDAERFRVLSFDYLGGSAETTGPGRGGLAAVPTGAVRSLAANDSDHEVGGAAAHRKRVSATPPKPRFPTSPPTTRPSSSSAFSTTSA
jgi:hypothetical protein